MRIKSVHLQDYKRFVDLTLTEIPENTRLVVLIGPNGSGKSSLFDAFLLKSWSASTNHDTLREGPYGGYYNRGPGGPQYTAEIANGIGIEFHSHADLAPNEWPAAFNIRSAYRNESDFRLQSIEAVQSSQESRRFSRIIDADQSVSDNYKRLTWKRQTDIDTDAEEDMTVGQYRREFLEALQAAMRDLFTEPSLSLQDFGGVTLVGCRIPGLSDSPRVLITKIYPEARRPRSIFCSIYSSSAASTKILYIALTNLKSTSLQPFKGHYSGPCSNFCRVNLNYGLQHTQSGL